jgi:hypothetical protein
MKASQPSENAELKVKFGSLIHELKAAKLHFSFYQRLVESAKGKDLLESWGFWNHTTSAHALSTFVHLCRVYDNYSANNSQCQKPSWNQKLFLTLKDILGVKSKNKIKKSETFHLSKFVKDVKQICGDKLKDKSERTTFFNDLNFLNNNQTVLKLRKWRNNVIGHRNQDLLLGGKNNFLKEFGFDDNEIHDLIINGFMILQHWATVYKSDYNKWICETNRANAQEEEDFSIILGALRLSRERQK